MGISKTIYSFFKSFPSLKIQYCTSEGIFGTINIKDSLSLNFINNIYFILFDENLLNSEETKNLILSFPALKLFSKEKKNIFDFYSVKNLIEN